MNTTFIFGHQNPDTDTITSALVYADLKTKLKQNVTPIRLGELNPETSFVLNYFNFETPVLHTNSMEGQKVILVDHNEFSQSAKDIEKATILEVIDHHRIANFETKAPLYYRAEAVGCTATILYKLYNENNITIDSKIAGLMISAIISDTLLLKSPTTTQDDINAANQLAIIAKIDIETYGLEMLKAGTNLDQYSEKELINLDAKNFSLGNSNTVVAQINTISISDTLKRKQQLIDEIHTKIASDNLDLFALIITDIINSNSQVIALGNQVNMIEEAFQVKLQDNEALLKGVISRKKQIIPELTRAAQLA